MYWLDTDKASGRWGVRYIMWWYCVTSCTTHALLSVSKETPYLCELLCMLFSIHPMIHYLFILHGSAGGWSQSQHALAKTGVTHDSHSHRCANLSPIHLSSVCSNCRRKDKSHSIPGPFLWGNITQLCLPAGDFVMINYMCCEFKKFDSSKSHICFFRISFKTKTTFCEKSL